MHPTRLIIVAVAALAACHPTSASAISAADPGPDGRTVADAGADAATSERAPACSGTVGRIVEVATAQELASALAAALPGDRIELADGTYPGSFSMTAPGTADQPIALCGSRNAVVEGTAVATGIGVHVQADFWVVSGFSVTRFQKGVVLDGAHHTVVWGLEVFDIGDEAIHLRAFSSDDVVRNCTVHETGRHAPGFGEGIYIGSARSNWDTYSGGNPDACDRNQVEGNVLGPNITAEAIDLKEGTQAGVIRGNVFDGHGMTGDNFGDSWIDVKGNDYAIDDNRGDTVLSDGFQTHVVVSGWGQGSTFHRNVITGVPGFAINVDAQSERTVVGCDNTAGDRGISNIACL